MESPLKSSTSGIGHGLDMSGAQGAPRQRMVLMVGNLTSEQLARVKDAIANTLGEVQCATFPSTSSSSVPSNAAHGEDGLASADPNNHVPVANFLDGFNQSKPALVTVCSGLESVCKRLQSVHKLENKVMKAVGAIAHYQKQQQDLADNFVRLSNKYQELKTSFHTVLWAYMPRLSEFGEIPLLDGALEEREGQVGNFSVGLLVGKGHFAEVKVCSLPGEDRRLVIKAIDKQRVKNVNGLTRISHEIEALRTLRHPHILHLHSVLHGKQFMYLVTERLSSDLYEFIGEHSSGVGEVLAKRIISPILDAVLFMHARGFVHRDLKPENILLDYTGSAAPPQGLDGSGTADFVIKVCDFGLCEKVAEHDAQLTEFCGSPGFMAPEMVIERAYDGRKADVWSVGCILLELLLTAKDFSTLWMKNFQDDLLEEPQRFKRQLYHTWGSLEVALRHRCSDELFAFVCGLLKIDPAARLSSADIPRIINPDNGRGLFAAVPVPPRNSTTSSFSAFSSSSSTAKRSSSHSPSPCVSKPAPSMASPPLFSSTMSLPCASSPSSPFAPPKPSLRHAESAPEASNLSHSHNNQPLHSMQQMQMQMHHSNNAPHHAPVPTHNNAPQASSASSASPSRLSPTPVASPPCHPLSGLLSTPAPQPSSSAPSSSSSSSRLSSSSSPSRPRPTQRHSSSARNSLRAQTLLKLESLSVGSHQYGRGRNRGLGPLSPGTPDVGIAKKFFEEDPQATASPATGSPCPGSPVHHGPLSGKASAGSTSLTSSGTSLNPSSPSSRTASPIVGPMAPQGTI